MSEAGVRALRSADSEQLQQLQLKLKKIMLRRVKEVRTLGRAWHAL
jgi:hypothetical protein